MMECQCRSIDEAEPRMVAGPTPWKVLCCLCNYLLELRISVPVSKWIRGGGKIQLTSNAYKNINIGDRSGSGFII